MSTGLGWYLDTIGRVPLLTPAEEIELSAAIRAWLDHPDGPDGCPAGIRRRGIKARDRFVHANLRLAVNYVSKKCRRLLKSADKDDVIQAANLGLLRAVEKFDPTRGYKFSTYAYWWLWQAVSKFVDASNGPITRPTHHAGLLARLATAARDHQQITGKAPTIDDLALATGLSVSRITALLEADRSCTSLDQLVGDHTELGDLMASPATDDLTPEQDLLQEQLSTLSPADQELIALRYGLNGPALSIAEVAATLGNATPSEVRARERRCIEQLRRLQQQPRQHSIERFSDRLGSQLALEITGHLQVVGSGALPKRRSNLKLHDSPCVAVNQLMLLIEDA